jgi:type 1 glutamine amidotransferase
MADKATLAVVTGSHPFDVPNFHKLFRALDGVDAYIQHISDFATSPEKVRDSYDAVCFYHMIMPTPVDGDDWSAGAPAAAQQRLGETGQGIVVLHHAILAYPEWDVWTDITGLADRAFDFHPDQQLHMDIANADHPITQGLSGWDMGDETYTMAEPVGDNDMLVTTDHDKCMHSIAWTRQYNASRVFCFQSGHDNVTWADGNFREVLRRGILWSARKL